MTATGRSPRTARRLAVIATVVALGATGAALLLAPGAAGDRDRRIDTARLAAKQSAAIRIRRSIADAPLARMGRCTRTSVVVGVGQACRTRDGMLVLATGRRPGTLTTHGPDLVDATPGEAAADGRFGTPDSIACSAPGTSRHVVLAYLLPADFATEGAVGVHGDRSAEVVPQLRQALLDAATVVDRRAGELASGVRRRLRVACGPDGQPIVERVVLPRTAAEYRTATSGGFAGIERDVAALGLLPEYEDFNDRRVASVRRLLGYYDADYTPGVAGQGVMFRRTQMLKQGARPSDPLVSRTNRNINNNPPNATFALQYGTTYDGVPDPPLYTSLLHELSHTMGAVQDEPATSSRAGHCIDGLDLMCYDDYADEQSTPGGRGREYAATACADPTPGTLEAADEVFDCNGDTYFHPAPPVGHPLADSRTWHLGLLGNETLTPVAAQPAPPAIGAVTTTGRGTQVVVRWPRAAAARGYDVSWRPVGGAWQSMAVAATTRPPFAVPVLRARTDYEFFVVARDARAFVGAASTSRRRTGIDTTPPTAPGRLVQTTATRSSIQLRFPAASDNERVTRYLLEQRVGTRWTALVSFPAPTAAAAGSVTSPRITRLRPDTAYVVRARALDARGQRSVPSPVVTAFTR